MRNFIYFLGSLSIAVAVAFVLRQWLASFDDPGYALLGIGQWSVEMSLAVFVLGAVFVFFVLYFFFRLLGWLLRLPGRIKDKRKHAKFSRSQDALIAGLVDSAEGNWAKAEKMLIKHASHSGAPLIHYLTAARAAQSRGAFEKRDEYLQRAKDEAPGSDIAIGLTQAELHLSGKEFDQAIEILSRLQSVNPGHAAVLKLLHQTYRRIGDWEGIRKLIPSLNKNKVLLETEIKLLETETFSELLKKAAEQGDVQEIKALWQSIPGHVKDMPGVRAIYFAAMIDSQAGAEIEDELTAALEKNWDETLIILYGCIQTEDYPAQLATAQKWLELHPNDAVLLRTLGKISMKCDDLEKAEVYINKSLSIEPSVSACRMLGELYDLQGKKDKSSEAYKRGLELASSEVVNQVEAINC